MTQTITAADALADPKVMALAVARVIELGRNPDDVMELRTLDDGTVEVDTLVTDGEPMVRTHRHCGAVVTTSDAPLS